MSDGEDGAETLEIDVSGANVVVRGHDELADLIQRRMQRLVCDVEEGVLRCAGRGSRRG